LRRVLLSAERFSDAAIFFGSCRVKTRCLRSSALLCLVTRCDQRSDVALFLLPLDFADDVCAAAFLRADLLCAGLAACW